MCKGQTLQGPLGFRIEIYDDFDVNFGSFWSRSWALLGGHFRSSGRLLPPKLVPESSSNRLMFEKVFFTKPYAFQWFWLFFVPKIVPQDDPRAPKTDP